MLISIFLACQSAGGWIPCDPPKSRIGHVAIALKGYVYVFGGVPEVKGDPVPTCVERLDTRDGTWSLGPALPSAMNFSAGGVCGDSILIAGGQDAGGVATAKAWIFDPDRRTLCEAAPMLSSRSRHACARLNGSLYMMGGFDERTGKQIAAIERYDSSANKWVGLPDMPTARHASAAAEFAGRLYVLGGFGDGPEAGRAVESFDPERSEWKSHAPLPSVRGFFGALSRDGRLVTFGGSYQPRFMDSFDGAADWRTARWTDVPQRRFQVVESPSGPLLVGGEPSPGGFVRPLKFGEGEIDTQPEGFPEPVR